MTARRRRPALGHGRAQIQHVTVGGDRHGKVTHYRLHAIQENLKARRIPVQSAEIAMIPKSTVRVDGRDAKQLLELIDALEEMDDVAKVWSNFDIDAETLAAATA